MDCRGGMVWRETEWAGMSVRVDVGRQDANGRGQGRVVVSRESVARQGRSGGVWSGV